MHLAEADRVEILVLVDNITDTLSSVPAFVQREWSRVQKAGMRFLSGGAICCANHGLGLVVTAHGPNGPRTMLFDAGPVDYAVEHNGTRLGLDFGAIEAAMLSHGHWDHGGGLPRALAMIRAANGARDVPLYLHPAMPRPLGARQPDGGVLPYEDIPTPERWRELGAAPVVTDQPLTCLDDLFFISGEIPRVTSYEKGIPNQVRHLSDGSWVPDTPMTDERFMAVNLRGKGLVVFSACSHAGIVNVLLHARESFPGVAMHAAMGGFHLAGPTEVAIPETVRDLGQFGLDYIIPGHCTGWRAQRALLDAYGEDVVLPCAVGKVFTL
jgi:7,8-dihydropterin-6-yl-methyl-4-(beta-D-ribofuranosyl)aminobenzene 5'-phosphate synthase